MYQDFEFYIAANECQVAIQMRTTIFYCKKPVIFTSKNIQNIISTIGLNRFFGNFNNILIYINILILIYQHFIVRKIVMNIICYTKYVLHIIYFGIYVKLVLRIIL